MNKLNLIPRKPLRLVARFRQWPQHGQAPAEVPDFYTRVNMAPMEGDDWASLESAGLIRLADDWQRWLRPVALPPGWALVSERDYYPSSLVDNCGRMRASLHIHRIVGGKIVGAWTEVLGRYAVDASHVGDYEVVGRVYDRDQNRALIYQTPILHRREYQAREAEADCKSAARAWLDENFVGWRSPNFGRDAAAAA